MVRAPAEQNAGIAEMSRAIMQLETVTQANAALVERAAATALTFEGEAERLAASVAAFKLDAEERHVRRR